MRYRTLRRSYINTREYRCSASTRAFVRQPCTICKRFTRENYYLRISLAHKGNELLSNAVRMRLEILCMCNGHPGTDCRFQKIGTETCFALPLRASSGIKTIAQIIFALPQTKTLSNLKSNSTRQLAQASSVLSDTAIDTSLLSI